MKRRLFFLHVQKTGGAALTGAISNRFAERECLLLYYSPEPDVSNADSFRYISGHVPISFVDTLRDPPFLFTFLRDPVERALSAYSYYRTRPPEFAKQLLLFGRGPEAYERAAECLRLARSYSIEDLIERAPEIAVEYFGNRQARALGNATPEGGDERLDGALAGLERCDFVGLTERLDESASWLVDRLGWQEITPLPRINVTGLRLRRDQVSPQGIDALCELTAVDRELYRLGVERYERQLAEWGEGGGGRDPDAEIGDASPVSDLRFDQPIRGAGWVGREPSADSSSFCWMGHTNTAWVELAPVRGASSLDVEIAHVLDRSILDGLRISVNGMTVPHTLAETDGAIVATAPLKRRRLPGRRRTARVTLEVDRTVRPCDIDPASRDDRQLSIAVRRIALRRH
jgi:hypothetical protein